MRERLLSILLIVVLAVPTLLALPVDPSAVAGGSTPPATPHQSPGDNLTITSVEYPSELYPFNYSDVLVLINNNSQISKDIGEYFVRARGIPSVNVAYLDVPARERINFSEYNQLKQQVKGYMLTNNLVTSINYIVTTKGVPLKTWVRGSNMNQIAYYYQACVDEELALIFSNYEIYNNYYGGVANPYFNNRTYFSRAEQGVYLVNRLTGYDWNDVKGLVDHVNESYGNRGKFVLDVDPSKDGSSGYRIGNDWLRNANTILSAPGEDVFFDNTYWYVTGRTNVMGYASWGSNDANDTDHAKPYNSWLNGSIAETFVSTGGRTFTYPPYYGQSMIADWIREGVTGIKGYVWEPFLGAIAHPDILFERYTAGFNLAESYRMASNQLSWMGVVVGDPKCSPYRDVPDFRLSDDRIGFTNSTPATGQEFEVTATVDNLGGHTEYVSVELYVDGKRWFNGRATFDEFSRTTVAVRIAAPVTPGEHRVRVVINDASAIFETITTDNEGSSTFLVKERPKVRLTANPTEVLTLESSHFVIEIIDAPRSLVGSSFDFGDGSVPVNMTNRDIYHAFSQDGTFTVTAHVVDVENVPSLPARVVMTVLNRAPVAIIDVEPFEALTKVPMTFNASTSYDDDGTVVAVRWDMGDGNTSEAFEVSHAYDRPGEYIVTLWVYDDDGAESRAKWRVAALNRQPVPEFVVDTEEVYKARSITFNATSSLDPDGRIIQYEWDYGDGSEGFVSSSPWAIHTYEKSGTMTVTLTVYDDLGGLGSVEATVEVLNRDPVAELRTARTEVLTGEDVLLDASRSYDPDGELVKYTFTIYVLGGVQVLETEEASPFYRWKPLDDGRYDVVVTVLDDDGAIAAARVEVLAINRPPTAILEAATAALDGSTEVVPTIVKASLIASDPDGRVERVEWFLGGTVAGEGADLDIPIDVEGQYTLMARVTDDDGAFTLYSVNFTANVLPTAAMTLRLGPEPLVEDRVEVKRLVTFDASTSSDPSGDLVYNWDFGDGTTMMGQVIDHSFLVAGQYTVRLTVEDPHGGKDSVERVLVVELPPESESGLGSLTMLLVVIVVVVVGAVAGYVLYNRGRRED